MSHMPDANPPSRHPRATTASPSSPRGSDPIGIRLQGLALGSVARARGWGISALSLVALLGLWEAIVRWAQIPAYTLPGPLLVGQTLVDHFGSLGPSWWFTVKVTLSALALATAGGVLLACAFALSSVIERMVLPLAVVLQVTPLVAIAPLILIYVESTTAALLLCSWIVAFFPILSNTLTGLRAADPQLQALFSLYRASPWQRLRLLLVPSALPYFLAGLKVSGGLSLIGAVTAEMVAGAAGRETGLASRILEASFRTETPKMFAALALLVATGLLIYGAFNALSALLLRRMHLPHGAATPLNP